MPFLTPKGLAQLQLFKKAVKAIAEKKYERENETSPYSQEMARNALAILDILEKNNDISLSEIDGLVKTIQPLVQIIDNNSFTAIPTVFNAQSLDLAIAFKAFLNEIKKEFAKNVGAAINFFLKMKSAYGKPEALLEQYIREIDANILIYTELALAKEKAIDAHTIKTEIMDNVFGHDQKPNPKTLFAKLNDQEYKEEDFQKEYETKVDYCLKKILSIPYVTIRHFPDYINQKSPYQIDPTELKLAGTKSLGKEILVILQKLEDEVNRRLTKKNWKQVSIVSKFKDEFFTIDKVDSHKSKILEVYYQIEQEIKRSLYGRKRFGIFPYGVDSRKKELLEGVLNEIKKSKESKAVGRNGELLETRQLDGMSRSLINVYISMLSAANLNVKLCSERGQRMNPGETSRILQTYAPRILALAIRDKGWGMDEEFCLESQRKKKLEDIVIREAQQKKEELQKKKEEPEKNIPPQPCELIEERLSSRLK